VLPVAVFLAVLVQTQIAAKSSVPRSSNPVRIPMAQIGLLVVSVMVVSVASLSQNLGWNTLGLVAALIIGSGVAYLDARNPTRLMPFGAYHLNRLGSMYACVALLSIGITVEMFVPYFLQVLHGHTPLAAGYLSALMSAGWTIGAVTSTSRAPATAGLYVRLGPIISAVSLASLGLMLPWEFLWNDTLRWV